MSNELFFSVSLSKGIQSNDIINRAHVMKTIRYDWWKNNDVQIPVPAAWIKTLVYLSGYVPKQAVDSSYSHSITFSDRLICVNTRWKRYENRNVSCDLKHWGFSHVRATTIQVEMFVNLARYTRSTPSIITSTHCTEIAN